MQNVLEPIRKVRFNDIAPHIGTGEGVVWKRGCLSPPDSIRVATHVDSSIDRERVHTTQVDMTAGDTVSEIGVPPSSRKFRRHACFWGWEPVRDGDSWCRVWSWVGGPRTWGGWSPRECSFEGGVPKFGHSRHWSHLFPSRRSDAVTSTVFWEVHTVLRFVLRWRKSQTGSITMMREGKSVGGSYSSCCPVCCGSDHIVLEICQRKIWRSGSECSLRAGGCSCWSTARRVKQEALVSQSTWKTRCRKSSKRFEKYDSLCLRNVKRVSGKRKGKIQVHQNHFHQTIQFHQNPLSSKTNFIKIQFHQKPISSKNSSIKNHFHQKPFSSQIKLRVGTEPNTIGVANKNIVRISVKASPAEGRRRFHRNTAYARLSGFNRPSRGASPTEGRRCSTWRSVEGRKAGV